MSAGVPSGHRGGRYALQLGPARAIASKDRHASLNSLHEPSESMRIGGFRDFTAVHSLRKTFFKPLKSHSTCGFDDLSKIGVALAAD